MEIFVIYTLNLFLRQGSYYVALTDLGWVQYVDQVDLKFRVIHLPQWRAGIKGMCHHAWLYLIIIHTPMPCEHAHRQRQLGHLQVEIPFLRGKHRGVPSVV